MQTCAQLNNILLTQNKIFVNDTKFSANIFYFI